MATRLHIKPETGPELWQRFRSSPYFALLVVVGVIAWAFAVSWLLLPASPLKG
jgi:hypothetical protein